MIGSSFYIEYMNIYEYEKPHVFEISPFHSSKSTGFHAVISQG